MHEELVQLPAVGGREGTQGLHRLRRPRRSGEGRCDQGDHRTRKLADISRCIRAARHDRTQENPNVRAAIHAPPAVCRRDRDFRSQLVQPRRCGACHGLHGWRGGSRSCRWLRFQKMMVESGIILLRVLAKRFMKKSRRVGSSRAWMTIARSGSCRRWISSRTAAGSTIRARVTTCSSQRIPVTRRGTSQTDDKRGSRSTSSGTCSNTSSSSCRAATIQQLLLAMSFCRATTYCCGEGAPAMGGAAGCIRGL